MAALPYIQMYPADYLADTMHLTTEEHGAYFLLILNYWQTAKPIAKERLSRIARLSNDRWNLVEASLAEFFNDTGTHWVHKRIEADLIMVNEAQEQRSKAGKASAEARKNKKREAEKALNKGSLTPVEIPLNGNSTNKDTDTDTDNKSSSRNKVSTLIPYQPITDLYNELCTELPKVIKLTDGRKRKIKTFWNKSKDHQSLDFYRNYFQFANTQRFFIGENKNQWKGSLDFMMNEDNAAKIYEGKYTQAQNGWDK